MNNTLIIIGFASALSAPEVAFCLIENGMRVVAFQRRNNRPVALSRCKGMEIAEITAPEDDVQQSIYELAQIYNSLGASAIMPLTDIALWMCDQLAVDPEVTVAGAVGKQAAFALDKRLQISAASAAGFNIPKTIMLNSAVDVDMIMNYPIILKPALAVNQLNNKLVKKEPLHFCAGKIAVNKALELWDGIQPLLAQSVCRGIGEGLFGFGTGGGGQAWCAHRRIRMMEPQGSGSSACQALPITDQPVDQAKKMLQGVNWHGQFMIELLRDEFGKLWFIELNGRSWGSMALALRMGFEYPIWTVRQALSVDYVPPDVVPNKYVTCRHLGRELVHIINVLRGPRSTAIPNWPSMGKTLYNVMCISKNDTWYNWRSNNKGVFMLDTYNTLMDSTIRKWMK